MEKKESLLTLRRLVYELRVCGKCRASLEWCPDDGEGMAARAYCRGLGRHLVVDWPGAPIEPVTILVQEVTAA